MNQIDLFNAIAAKAAAPVTTNTAPLVTNSPARLNSLEQLGYNAAAARDTLSPEDFAKSEYNNISQNLSLEEQAALGRGMDRYATDAHSMDSADLIDHGQTLAGSYVEGVASGILDAAALAVGVPTDAALGMYNKFAQSRGFPQVEHNALGSLMEGAHELSAGLGNLIRNDEEQAYNLARAARSAAQEEASARQYQQDLDQGMSEVNAMFRETLRDIATGASNVLRDTTSITDTAGSVAGTLTAGGGVSKVLGAGARKVLKELKDRQLKSAYKKERTSLLNQAKQARGSGDDTFKDLMNKAREARTNFNAAKAAPYELSSMAQRGVNAVALGATEAGGSVGESAKQIDAMSDQQLLNQSPEFKDMVQQRLNSGQRLEDALAGAREDLKRNAAYIEAATGGGAALLAGAMMDPLGKIASKATGAKDIISKAMGASAYEATEEAFTGLGQGIGANLAAQQTYNPEERLTKGIGFQAGEGLVGGAIAGGGLNTIGNAVYGTAQSINAAKQALNNAAADQTARKQAAQKIVNDINTDPEAQASMFNETIKKVNPQRESLNETVDPEDQVSYNTVKTNNNKNTLYFNDKRLDNPLGINKDNELFSGKAVNAKYKNENLSKDPNYNSLDLINDLAKDYFTEAVDNKDEDKGRAIIKDIALTYNTLISNLQANRDTSAAIAKMEGINLNADKEHLLNAVKLGLDPETEEASLDTLNIPANLQEQAKDLFDKAKSASAVYDTISKKYYESLKKAAELEPTKENAALLSEALVFNFQGYPNDNEVETFLGKLPKNVAESDEVKTLMSVNKIIQSVRNSTLAPEATGTAATLGELFGSSNTNNLKASVADLVRNIGLNIISSDTDNIRRSLGALYRLADSRQSKRKAVYRSLASGNSAKAEYVSYNSKTGKEYVAQVYAGNRELYDTITREEQAVTDIYNSSLKAIRQRFKNFESKFKELPPLTAANFPRENELKAQYLKNSSSGAKAADISSSLAQKAKEAPTPAPASTSTPAPTNTTTEEESVMEEEDEDNTNPYNINMDPDSSDDSLDIDPALIEKSNQLAEQATSKISFTLPDDEDISSYYAENMANVAPTIEKPENNVAIDGSQRPVSGVDKQSIKESEDIVSNLNNENAPPTEEAPLEESPVANEDSAAPTSAPDTNYEPETPTDYGAPEPEPNPGIPDYDQDQGNADAPDPSKYGQGDHNYLDDDNDLDGTDDSPWSTDGGPISAEELNNLLDNTPPQTKAPEKQAASSQQPAKQQPKQQPAPQQPTAPSGSMVSQAAIANANATQESQAEAEAAKDEVSSEELNELAKAQEENIKATTEAAKDVGGTDVDIPTDLVNDDTTAEEKQEYLEKIKKEGSEQLREMRGMLAAVNNPLPATRTVEILAKINDPKDPYTMQTFFEEEVYPYDVDARAYWELDNGEDIDTLFRKELNNSALKNYDHNVAEVAVYWNNFTRKLMPKLFKEKKHPTPFKGSARKYSALIKNFDKTIAEATTDSEKFQANLDKDTFTSYIRGILHTLNGLVENQTKRPKYKRDENNKIIYKNGEPEIETVRNKNTGKDDPVYENIPSLNLNGPGGMANWMAGNTGKDPTPKHYLQWLLGITIDPQTGEADYSNLRTDRAVTLFTTMDKEGNVRLNNDIAFTAAMAGFSAIQEMDLMRKYPEPDKLAELLDNVNIGNDDFIGLTIEQQHEIMYGVSYDRVISNVRRELKKQLNFKSRDNVSISFDGDMFLTALTNLIVTALLVNGRLVKRDLFIFKNEITDIATQEKQEIVTIYKESELKGIFGTTDLGSMRPEDRRAKHDEAMRQKFPGYKVSYTQIDHRINVLTEGAILAAIPTKKKKSDKDEEGNVDFEKGVTKQYRLKRQMSFKSKDNYDVVERVLTNVPEKMPKFAMEEVDKTAPAHKKRSDAETTELERKAIVAQNTTPHYLNKKLLKIFEILGIEGLYDLLGLGVEEATGLVRGNKKYVASINARRDDIARQYEAALVFVKRAIAADPNFPKAFFEVLANKIGRIDTKCPISPQTSKLIRALFSVVMAPIHLDKEREVLGFKRAVLQAFGKKIVNMSDEQVIADFAKAEATIKSIWGSKGLDYSALSDKKTALEEINKFNKAFADSIDGSPETVYLGLQAIIAMGDYLEAVDSGKKVFINFLPVELDGKTNGVKTTDIRYNTGKSMSPKAINVGDNSNYSVGNDNTTAYERAAAIKTDNYTTVANGLKNRIINLTNDLIAGEDDPEVNPVLKTEHAGTVSKLNLAHATYTFTSLIFGKDFIYQTEIRESEDTEGKPKGLVEKIITAVARAIVKYPVIRNNYGQGKNSNINSLISDLDTYFSERLSNVIKNFPETPAYESFFEEEINKNVMTLEEAYEAFYSFKDLFAVLASVGVNSKGDALYAGKFNDYVMRKWPDKKDHPMGAEITKEELAFYKSFDLKMTFMKNPTLRRNLATFVADPLYEALEDIKTEESKKYIENASFVFNTSASILQQFANTALKSYKLKHGYLPSAEEFEEIKKEIIKRVPQYFKTKTTTIDFNKTVRLTFGEVDPVTNEVISGDKILGRSGSHLIVQGGVDKGTKDNPKKVISQLSAPYEVRSSAPGGVAHNADVTIGIGDGNMQTRAFAEKDVFTQTLPEKDRSFVQYGNRFDGFDINPALIDPMSGFLNEKDFESSQEIAAESVYLASQALVELYKAYEDFVAKENAELDKVQARRLRGEDKQAKQLYKKVSAGYNKIDENGENFDAIATAVVRSHPELRKEFSEHYLNRTIWDEDGNPEPIPKDEQWKREKNLNALLTSPNPMPRDVLRRHVSKSIPVDKKGNDLDAEALKELSEKKEVPLFRIEHYSQRIKALIEKAAEDAKSDYENSIVNTAVLLSMPLTNNHISGGPLGYSRRDPRDKYRVNKSLSNEDQFTQTSAETKRRAGIIENHKERLKGIYERDRVLTVPDDILEEIYKESDTFNEGAKGTVDRLIIEKPEPIARVLPNTLGKDRTVGSQVPLYNLPRSKIVAVDTTKASTGSTSKGRISKKFRKEIEEIIANNEKSNLREPLKTYTDMRSLLKEAVDEVTGTGVMPGHLNKKMFDTFTLFVNNNLLPGDSVEIYEDVQNLILSNNTLSPENKAKLEKGGTDAYSAFYAPNADGVGGKIYLFKDKLKHLNKEDRYKVILHETIHAIMGQAISRAYKDEKTLDKKHPHYKEVKALKSLMDYAADTLKKHKDNLYETHRSYIWENPDERYALNEFVAFMLTEPTYIKIFENKGRTKKHLNAISHLFKSFKLAVKKLFGFKSEKDVEDFADLYGQTVILTRHLAAEELKVRATARNTTIGLSDESNTAEKTNTTIAGYYAGDTPEPENRILNLARRIDDVTHKLLSRLPDPDKADAALDFTQARRVNLATIIDGLAKKASIPLTRSEVIVAASLADIYSTEFKLNPNTRVDAINFRNTLVDKLKPSHLYFEADQGDPTKSEIRYNILAGTESMPYLGKEDISLGVFMGLLSVSEDLRSNLNSLFKMRRRDLKVSAAVKASDSSIDAFIGEMGERALQHINTLIDFSTASPLKAYKSKRITDLLDQLNDSMLKINKEASALEIPSKALSFLDNEASGLLDSLGSFIATYDGFRKLIASDSTLLKYLGVALKIPATVLMKDSNSIYKAQKELILRSINTYAIDHPNWLSRLSLSLFKELATPDKNAEEVFQAEKQAKATIQASRTTWKEVAPRKIKEMFLKEGVSLSKDDCKKLNHIILNSDIGVLSDSIIDSVMKGHLKEELNDRLGYFNEFIVDKIEDLATYLHNGKLSHGMLRNAKAIATMYDKPDDEELIDEAITLRVLTKDVSALKTAKEIYAKAPKAFMFAVAQQRSNSKKEKLKAETFGHTMNIFKGYYPRDTITPTVVRLIHREALPQFEAMGFKEIGVTSDRDYSYVESTINPLASFSQGGIQSVISTTGGIDVTSGLAVNGLTYKVIRNSDKVKVIASKIDDERVRSKEAYLPILNEDGEVDAYEVATDYRMYANVQKQTDFAINLGGWKGRQVEETLATELNTSVIENLKNQYEEAIGTKREQEFVDIFELAKEDRVIADAVRNIPSQTKKLLMNDKNELQPFYVRRDLVDDVIGRRQASVIDLATGKTRWSPEMQKNMVKVATAILGRDAMAKLYRGEKIISSISSSIRNHIVIRSAEVMLFNILGNTISLLMRGVPIHVILKEAPKIAKELEHYHTNRQRIAILEMRLNAEKGKDHPDFSKIKAAETRLNQEINALDSYDHIKDLIREGEFSTIADLGDTNDDALMYMGRMGEYINKAIDKTPNILKSAGRQIFLTKDTAIYRTLEKGTQYGDFIAKAILYKHLTEKKGIRKSIALAKIRNEFVNYDMLPGRSREYLENMGLLWFYNYKLRITKTALSLIKENPVSTALMATSPLLSTIGTPVTDNILAKILTNDIGGSVGIKLFDFPWLTNNMWVNIFSPD